jgi:type VI secretion system protein ImpM
MTEVSAAVGYFGKLPSRGDFVRSADNRQLMNQLDRWVGSSMELLSQNIDWKRLYDDMPELYYAFMGSRSRLVICGHFLRSYDASQRRFPFLSAIPLEVAEPLRFIARSPMALSRTWAGVARLAREAIEAQDATTPLIDLTNARFQVNTDPAAYDSAFADFLEMQTIGSLQRILRESGHEHIQIRHMLPALGLLLQPVLSGTDVNIDKALELPLPRDPLYRPLVTAFWLDVVAAFLGRGDFELAVLIHDKQMPQLLIGFNGADQQILRTAIDSQVAAEYLIRLCDSEWVEDYLPGDYALNKLASYIDRDDLTLKSARAIFSETFLGM